MERNRGTRNRNAKPTPNNQRTSQRTHPSKQLGILFVVHHHSRHNNSQPRRADVCHSRNVAVATKSINVLDMMQFRLIISVFLWFDPRGVQRAFVW